MRTAREQQRAAQEQADNTQRAFAAIGAQVVQQATVPVHGTQQQLPPPPVGVQPPVLAAVQQQIQQQPPVQHAAVAAFQAVPQVMPGTLYVPPTGPAEVPGANTGATMSRRTRRTGGNR